MLSEEVEGMMLRPQQSQKVRELLGSGWALESATGEDILLAGWGRVIAVSASGRVTFVRWLSAAA